MQDIPYQARLNGQQALSLALWVACTYTCDHVPRRMEQAMVDGKKNYEIQREYESEKSDVQDCPRKNICQKGLETGFCFSC